MYTFVQIISSLISINSLAYKSGEFITSAIIQVEAIAQARNCDEIKCTVIGKTIAINRSKAIQTRLSTDTVSETFWRYHFSLQLINPGVPRIGHWRELQTASSK